MESIRGKEKLVSIIIPVYNAGAYLGYCLNSVISQTHSNIEIILVNDGSTDNSYEICQNYAAIDGRIVGIDIENSGVSDARNVGLKEAKGEYVLFVDADDVIKSDMVEALVKRMETYQKDIVFCGFDMVTLENNEVLENVPISSAILGSECVLNRDVFFAKLAFILWKTSLLECVCGKLMRMDVIRNNHIMFPPDLSFGEDFCFNMEYFRHINGAVFVSSRYYYYLQRDNDSLTKKYREDLFENQMYLIRKFRSLIEENVKISKSEQTALSEYTVAHMMHVLYALTGNRCPLNTTEKKREIARIINDKSVRNAYQHTKYIEPRYEWIRECMEYSDIQKIYDILFNRGDCGRDEAGGKKIWWLRRFLIKGCEFILKIHYFKSVELIMNSLKRRSIRKTIIKGMLKIIGKSKGYDEA